MSRENSFNTARDMIHPVILCGGSGSRLWPLSRKSYPKQFAQLIGEETLFQASALRMQGPRFAAPCIVTNDSFRFIVTDQLSAIDCTPERILIEPSARNTAAAVLAATLATAQHGEDALLLIAPSDQVIPDRAAFQNAVMAACDAARGGQIITFGISPTRAETGYGYLELAGAAAKNADTPQPLMRFVEKPDSVRAQDMFLSGKFLWNAGIFLFSVKTMRAAFAAYCPDLLEGVSRSIADAENDLAFCRLAPQPWDQLADISIDYAVMEKAPNLSVMPYHGHWSDLGGWEAVWQESGPDAAGNVVSDAATAIDCTGTLLRSEAGSLELVGIGLQDMIAIAMPDAVLIAPKALSQRAKEAVDALKAKKATQAEAFPRDHRPWGWFESLAQGERFQVKRIVVTPGGSLSLQSHHHRAEHWIVVQGTARVTLEDEVKLISENQSIYIPLGEKHRLENPGKVNVVLIEVQTGSYLGEDDIIRYEDVYKRG